ncbi:hypothetical protein GCM10011607_12350 [Shewanella inventionis]|uniref:Uncharacterized protein n=2 Tax=Shewanella inventionis TaxID=1738770 RepID=A0ABQ1IXA5_9GAMM|nr:hypothetical protein GCM10011607_12350 [Shewanella inventionis]
MSKINPEKVIFLLHYDKFLNKEHLHGYLINLVDELFTRLAYDDAKRVMSELLNCFKPALPNIGRRNSLDLEIKSMSRWKYKQLIRLGFFKDIDFSLVCLKTVG